MPAGDPKRSNLRQAYSCANDVYEELRRQPVPTYEDQLCMDVASMIVEAIACYNNNQRINSKSFMQILRQQHYGKQPHLYKLGFALSVLLNALLIERFPLPSTSSCRMNKATTSRADAAEPATERPLFRSPSKAADEIKQEPTEEEAAIIAEAEQLLFGPSETTNDDVKKEPVEVKEEPADDGYEAVKEEPLVDVFCPATGSSRPLDSMDHTHTDEEILEEAGTSWTAKKSGLAPQPKTAVKRKATDTRDPKLNKRTGPSNFVGKGRACYMCAAITEDYETTPPLSDQPARQEFFDRIIRGSQIARDRVDKLRHMRVTAFFCSKHIAAPKKPPTIESNKKSDCDLCDDPQLPLSAAPSNPFTRRRFFNTMLPLNNAQQKKVDAMINNPDSKMNFCARHFKLCDKPKLDDLDKKGERFASAINARKSSILRKQMPAAPPAPAIKIAFPRVSPIRIDVGYPSEEAMKEEPTEILMAPRKEYLHLAYDRICALCETLVEQSQTTAEDELLLGLASLTAQALDCINNDKAFQREYLLSAPRSVNEVGKAESPFLKLGYPLTVLLNELLAFRFDIDISPQAIYAANHQAAGSSSEPPYVAKEEAMDDKNGYFTSIADCAPGITAVIGEETPLFKEELLEDLGQEPPVADMYCPATGSSRPVNRVKCRPSGSEFIPSSSTTTNRNMAKSNNDGVITWDLANQTIVNTTEGKITWDMAARLLEEEPFLPPEKECYLCGTVTTRYRSVPSARSERFIFLGSILMTSRREEVLVAALSASRATAHFCMQHISRSALARTPDCVQAAQKRQPYKRVQRSVKMFKNEVKISQCDLCEKPEFPIGVAPKNPISCRRFLSSLCKLTPSQEAMIEMAKSGNSHGISRICAKHFKKKMIRPGTEPNNLEQDVKEEDYDEDYPEPGPSTHF